MAGFINGENANDYKGGGPAGYNGLILPLIILLEKANLITKDELEVFCDWYYLQQEKWIEERKKK